jgi:hypothetical protein
MINNLIEKDQSDKESKQKMINNLIEKGQLENNKIDDSQGDIFQINNNNKIQKLLVTIINLDYNIMEQIKKNIRQKITMYKMIIKIQINKHK